MHFDLDPEQQLIVESVRAFVDTELQPHEEEVERANEVSPTLRQQIRDRALAAGLYAANMPAELGGGGLDHVGLTLLERELGRTSYALQWAVFRPSNILRACVGDQVDRYLLPAIRGERIDCLAMSEPGAGSDLQSMQTQAERAGEVYIVNGAKHFISYADVADFMVLFAVTGSEETARGERKLITAFLVDKDTPGLEVRIGPRSVSHRGYHHCELTFVDCELPAGQILGEEHRGFEVANEWLGASRLSVATQCVGRAQRALELAVEWAATREQFGQKIGRFQGTGFKLADMATEIDAAELLVLRTA